MLTDLNKGDIISYSKIAWMGNAIDYHLYYLGAELRKGGSAMNFVITLDWKFVVALGTAAVGVIFAVKMDGSAAERVSTHAVDACKEYAIAGNSDR